MIGIAPDLPEPDRAEGAAHPRFAMSLVGHERAQSQFLEAVNTGRLHHAWLITGPPGIGKATLAWRLARFLLTTPEPSSDASLFGAPEPLTSLDPGPDTAPLSRVEALSEPGLFLLRRGWDAKTKKLRTVITVDEVRALNGFFALSRPDGGRRVVIVDAADEMNANAANALLKRLEEPPAQTVFLLVSHMPSRLLPTIRSRCRTLPCTRLPEAQMAEVLARLLPDTPADERAALAQLADGSPGTALRLQVHDGVSLGREIDALLASMPGVDRMRAVALAAGLSARDAQDKRSLCLDLMDQAMARIARAGVLGGDGPLARLAPDPDAGRRWAQAQQDESARVRRGLAVNLDAHSLILDMVLRIDKLAADCAAGR
ncbi:DNA polymerase III subunit delta' [Meridianimarinicoccus marinus]|uniref:DNA polymerase III subunit delta' n=1 Tax=Meridianimarinicoccus marinus TaxID=3231483 RepID=UPI003F4ED38D